MIGIGIAMVKFAIGERDWPKLRMPQRKVRMDSK